MEWLKVTAICVVLISPLTGGIALMALLGMKLLENSTTEEETDTKTK